VRDLARRDENLARPVKQRANRAAIVPVRCEHGTPSIIHNDNIIERR
jgi:hypothetical protein